MFLFLLHWWNVAYFSPTKKLIKLRILQKKSEAVQSDRG